MALRAECLLVVLAACGSGGGGPVASEPSCEVAGRALVQLVADPGNKLASTDPDEKQGNERAIKAWTRELSSACERDKWPKAAIECFSKAPGKPELETCRTTLAEKQRESVRWTIEHAAKDLVDGSFTVRMTKGGTKTFRVGGRDVTLELPVEWRDQSTEDRVVLNTMKGSWIKVSSTCHGTCGDAEVLAKNIATVAKERLEHTMSDSFRPTLESVWDEQVTERAPKEFHYTFHGNAKDKDKNWGVKYITVDRIVGDRVLHCTVEMVSKDFDQLAAVGATCAKLVVAQAK